MRKYVLLDRIDWWFIAYVNAHEHLVDDPKKFFKEQQDYNEEIENIINKHFVA